MPLPNGRYIVQTDDTLMDIVRRTNPGMSESMVKKEAERLGAVNGIDPDYIVVGQVLTDTATATSSSAQSKTRVTIAYVGVKASDSKTAVVGWSWSDANKKKTESYTVVWEYLSTVVKANKDTRTDWYNGKIDNPKVEDFYYSAERSEFTIPDGATQIRVKVRPNAKEDYKDEVKWAETNWYNVVVASLVPPDLPTELNVEIKDFNLIATLSELDTNTVQGVEFKLLRANQSSDADVSVTSLKTTRVNSNTDSKMASTSFGVSSGLKYYIQYRAFGRLGVYSDWSGLKGPYYTVPSTPEIKNSKATSDTEIYIAWSSVSSADSYEVRYSTEKRYLEISSNEGVTTVSDIKTTETQLVNLTAGNEYFFQVRAVNDKGESGWSTIDSIIIGEVPAPPTTWSSVNTTVIGESVYLYWVHNSADGSIQKFANLEVNGTPIKILIDSEDAEDGVTSMVELVASTSSIALYMKGTSIATLQEYSIGKPITWKVQTAGVTGIAGEWSIERTIEAYERPTLDTHITDGSGNELSTITSFPFHISCVAYPKEQTPISYNIAISAGENYDTVNNVGNEVTITAGTRVYSKHIDGNISKSIEIGAGDVNLENNVTYILSATAFMDSGLTANSTKEFTVRFGSAPTNFSLDALVTLDAETVTTTIVPYCENGFTTYYEVEKIGNMYVLTDNEITGPMGRLFVDERGSPFSSAITTTGEMVFRGTSAVDGERYFYHEVSTTFPVNRMLLSVYRREFDGSFTELSKDLPGENWTAIIDPHPALDYARYRLVAKSIDTGETSYYDLPAYEVGIKYVVIQWDETWSAFDYSDEHELSKAPWSGSLLKLPYNIDVSDSYDADVTLVNYIGREHPVSYYGTQIGQTATWEMSIDKTDAETLYGLRRLARWMGDVYVREPSGSGYWAKVRVSFNQKHTDPIAPVSLEITRVDGGA